MCTDVESLLEYPKAQQPLPLLDETNLEQDSKSNFKQDSEFNFYAQLQTEPKLIEVFQEFIKIKNCFTHLTLVWLLLCY